MEPWLVLAAATLGAGGFGAFYQKLRMAGPNAGAVIIKNAAGATLVQDGVIDGLVERQDHQQAEIRGSRAEIRALQAQVRERDEAALALRRERDTIADELRTERLRSSEEIRRLQGRIAHLEERVSLLQDGGSG